MVSQHVAQNVNRAFKRFAVRNTYLKYFDSWSNGKHMKLKVTIVISFSLENNIYSVKRKIVCTF